MAAGARGRHSHHEPGTLCVRAAGQGCGAARGPSAGSASTPGPAGWPGAAQRWAGGSARTSAGAGPGGGGAGPAPPPRAQPSGGHPGLATWEPAPGGLAAHFPGSKQPQRHHEEVVHRWAPRLGRGGICVPGRAFLA